MDVKNEIAKSKEQNEKEEVKVIYADQKKKEMTEEEKSQYTDYVLSIFAV